MGNIKGCCNNQAQLSNISQSHSIYLEDNYEDDHKNGKASQIAKTIKKIENNLARGLNRKIQFPEISKSIEEVIKRSKTLGSETNDNQDNNQSEKKEILGFKSGEGMAVYEGSVISGKAEGIGRIAFSDKSYFEGEFTNGAPVHGIFVFSHSMSYYKGKISGFQASGKGYLQHIENGYTYEGMWEKNLQHGYGIQKFRNGDKYDGNFMYGNKFGEGRYEFANGDVYEGSFYNGYFDGKGKLRLKSGESYEGDWKLGKMEGEGTFEWNNGEKYIGQYKDGQREGQGIYYYQNNSRYQGQWRKGLQHGRGAILQSYDEVTGLWEQGVMIQQQ